MENKDLKLRLEENYKKYEQLLDNLIQSKQYKIASDLIDIYHETRRLRYEKGAAMVRNIYTKQ